MAKLNDSIDRRLLALLQANSRQTAATLGRKLGIARTTVQERIARLERTGAISGYTIVLKRDVFGSTVEFIVLIAITQSRQKQIVEQIRQLPEISSCLTVSGDFELFCRARVAQFEDVQPVLQEISNFTGVEKVRAIMILASEFERGDSEIAGLSIAQASLLGRGEM